MRGGLTRSIRRRWREVGGPDGERGWVTFWVLPMFAFLLMFAGLIVDGGRAIAAREHAADVAEQAARTGADQIDLAALHADPDSPQIDPDEARTAAKQVCQGAGITDCQVTLTADDKSITVYVSVTVKTAILSLIHVNTLGGSAQATATAVQAQG